MQALVVSAVLTSALVAHAILPSPGPQAPSAALPRKDSPIPTNARLVFIGLPVEDVRYQRVDTQEWLLLTTEPAGRPGSPERAYLTDPGPLVPGQPLVIQPACADCLFEDPSYFDVIDDVDDEPPGFMPGAIADVDADESGTDACPDDAQGEYWCLTALFPPPVDDHGPLLVRTEATEGIAGLQRHEGDPTTPFLAWSRFEPGPHREVCMTITAIDVAGHETPFGDAACAEVGEQVGCSQTGGSAFALTTFALVAAPCRRIRRPLTDPAPAARSRPAPRTPGRSAAGR